MNIEIRPSIKQFWAENVTELLACFICLPIVLYFDITNSLYTIIPSSVFFSLLLYLIGRYLNLRSFEWVISSEVIYQKRGLLSSIKDHIEMYRVVDYQETQSLWQRVLGVKTVILASTDKLNSTVAIRGVPENSRLMNIVRERVELCKRNKRVYEVTNN